MKSSPLNVIAARMETIRRDIARLEAELDRLKIAGEVMAELGGIPVKEAQQVLLGPVIEHRKGFTIRRTINAEAVPVEIALTKAGKPKGGKSGKPRATRTRTAGIRPDILAALDNGQKLRSSDIAHKVFGDAPGEKDFRTVWRTLHIMKQDGQVIREESGQYMRPPAANSAGAGHVQ